MGDTPQIYHSDTDKKHAGCFTLDYQRVNGWEVGDILRLLAMDS